MQRIFLIILALVIILVFVAFLQGGTELVLQGFRVGLYRLGSVVFLVAAAYLISGFAQVIFSPEKFNKWLGPRANIKGFMAMLAAGALTPGGPYVFYPVAASLSGAGAKFPFIIVYLAGKTLWDLWRIPMELALLGTALTIIRWQATFFIPFLIVLCFFVFSGLEKKEAEADC